MSAASGCEIATRLVSKPTATPPARVLVVHNHYQQAGGEDQVFRAEAQLLRQQGHAVREYTADNRGIGAGLKLRLALETIWSERSARGLREVVRDFRPDVAHFHNTFPLISPSAYYACRSAGVAVVQTLHNYRLGCPKATFYRDGRVCEDCLGKALAWPGALHGCYRGSRATSAVIGAMNATHRLIGTWQGQVDRYIALSNFQRTKLIATGIPAAKIAVKGNFVDPDPGTSDRHLPYMVFVGRLIAEKGIHTLLTAWRQVAGDVPLKIVGDGAMSATVAEAARTIPGIKWLGRRPSGDVQQLIGSAAALLVPSEWHEPFGLVAIEAFAKGTPVIAAQSGALPEIVEHGRTGLLFPPGATLDLAACVMWAATHPTELAEMGRAARREFETSYTSARNYAMLTAIYRDALGGRA
jgi:glycosyltransferase involved in cell wall biosynthesis